MAGVSPNFIINNMFAIYLKISVIKSILHPQFIILIVWNSTRPQNDVSALLQNFINFYRIYNREQINIH